MSPYGHHTATLEVKALEDATSIVPGPVPGPNVSQSPKVAPLTVDEPVLPGAVLPGALDAEAGYGNGNKESGPPENGAKSWEMLRTAKSTPDLHVLKESD